MYGNHGCKFDYMCIHAYYSPDEAKDVSANITRLYKEYGYKFWLNEFSCPPWLEKYTEEM